MCPTWTVGLLIRMLNPHPEILEILYEFGGLKYGNTFPEQKIIMLMNKPSFQVHSKYYLHFKFPWRNRNQVLNIKKNHSSTPPKSDISSQKVFKWNKARVFTEFIELLKQRSACRYHFLRLSAPTRFRFSSIIHMVWYNKEIGQILLRCTLHLIYSLLLDYT